MSDTKEETEKNVPPQLMEASFSTLVMSLGSASLMSMGIIPDPATGKTQKDMAVAKFNIDLLVMLREKTNGNLSAEEKQTVDAIISDLQLKFVETSK